MGEKSQPLSQGAAVKDINLQKSKKLPVQTLLFSCLKFVSVFNICSKNFGKFHGRKFKKITNKAIKMVNNAFIWAFIIQH